MLRQPSQPTPETANHRGVKLERSQTVVGGVSSASLTARGDNKLGQLDQQDRIERGETNPGAEECTLEPNVTEITIEVSEAESGEERVISKLEDKDNERVKVGAERSDQEGVDDEEESEVRESVTRAASIDEDLRDSPAFKFITRPDLYKFAKVTSCLSSSLSVNDL